MNNKDNEKEVLFSSEIPGNVLSNSYPFGIHFTHWLEAGAFISIADYIVWHIGFVDKVKWIIIVVISISFLIIFLYGLRGHTYTGVLINWLISFKKRREYHLGGINDDRKAANNAEYAGKSTAEQIRIYLGKKFKAFDKRYGEEPEEEKNRNSEGSN